MQTWLETRQRVLTRRGHGRSTTSPATGALDLASNDYLGLSREPRVLAAAHDALDEHGAGARASRVVTGTTSVHVRLEDALRELTGSPAALACSSGYAANLAVLSTLGGPGTCLLLDAHAHASLHDGARLSRARTELFAHDDLSAAATALERRTEPRAVVAVESVYSVLGDAPDLAAWADLCRRHDAMLLVDESHGIGVLGDGRGAAHASGLAGRDDVIVTTSCAKALGAQGGAVLSSPAVRETIVSTGRAFVYDAGLAPASAAAAAEAALIIRDEPWRTEHLRVSRAAICEAAGIPKAPGAVQSLPAPDAWTAVAVTQALAAEGILIGCFRPPSTPDGLSRLRLTARADIAPALSASAARRTVELLTHLTEECS